MSEKSEVVVVDVLMKNETIKEGYAGSNGSYAGLSW